MKLQLKSAKMRWAKSANIIKGIKAEKFSRKWNDLVSLSCAQVSLGSYVIDENTIVATINFFKGNKEKTSEYVSILQAAAHLNM